MSDAPDIADFRDIKNALQRIDGRLGKIEERLEKLEDRLGHVDERLRKVEIDLAELRGRVSQLPTLLQMLGFVLAVLAAGGLLRHFFP